MSEKLDLIWNDFQSNVIGSIGMFRNESFLHDVTLVSDDFKQVTAHKLVLSSCSEYFQRIFKETSKEQPLICLDGINSEDLRNVLDYAYDGVVKLYQEDLDRFLNIAQSLQIKGLENEIEPEVEEEVGELNEEQQLVQPFKEDNFQDNDSIMKKSINEGFNGFDNIFKKSIKEGFKGLDLKTLSRKTVKLPENTDPKEWIEKQVVTNEDRTVSCKVCGKISRAKDLGTARWNLRKHIEIHIEGRPLKIYAIPQNAEHNELVNEQIIINGDNTYSCKICGKTDKRQFNLRRHIEVHIGGSYPCTICSKIFRSVNSLQNHKNCYKLNHC